jgi:hypothetical protein
MSIRFDETEPQRTPGESIDSYRARYKAWLDASSARHLSDRMGWTKPRQDAADTVAGRVWPKLDASKKEPTNAYERNLATGQNAHEDSDGRISARRDEDAATPSRVTPQTKFASLDPLEGAPGEVRRDDGAPAAKPRTSGTPAARTLGYERNVREGLDAHKTSATRIGAK